MLRKLLVAIATTTLIATGITELVQAASLTEGAVDAGNLVGTARQADTSPAGTTLDSINGSIGFDGDIDLYQIYSPGGSFSASTVGGTGIDSQLFLFNSGGFGLAASNDTDTPSPFSFQSTIPSITLPVGNYYIGISIAGYDPQSSGGPIFNLAVADPTTSPNGSGGGFALSSWSANPIFPETGTYSISLTGAEFIQSSAAATPFEFSPTFGLLILGIWSAWELKKRQIFSSTHPNRDVPDINK